LYRIFPLLCLLTLGCSSDRATTKAETPTVAAEAQAPPEREAPKAGPAPEAPQRTGDPKAGYQAILDAAYVNCGVPSRLYGGAAILGLELGGAPAPGRADSLPFYLSRLKTRSGQEVVGPNCLSCHAGFINGKLVIGLGDTQQDYSDTSYMVSELSPATLEAVSALAFLSKGEQAELEKFAQRLRTVMPYTKTAVRGVNPADNLAAILFAHRDPKTLKWHDKPLLEPPPSVVVPVDTPPWWRMAKKRSMFYVGAGRGDHARIMMTASTLCVDTMEGARAVDKVMPDVAAFIRSIEPPAWPWSVDQKLATRGRDVFEDNCAECHGTYRDDPGHTYPNKVVDLADIGTDPMLARGASQFAHRFIDWYRKSFYGETARLEPQKGYVAPPLDGIWATAPFLHNGSVPTLATLLDSSKRPRFWRRSFRSRDYDRDAVGWRYRTLSKGHRAGSGMNRSLYDTSIPGYSNAGHTYGDSLSQSERTAVLEYLKTL